MAIPSVRYFPGSAHPKQQIRRRNHFRISEVQRWGLSEPPWLGMPPKKGKGDKGKKGKKKVSVCGVSSDSYGTY